MRKCQPFHHAASYGVSREVASRVRRLARQACFAVGMPRFSAENTANKLRRLNGWCDSASVRSANEPEAGDFGRAKPAGGRVAGNAAGDVQDRRRRIVDARDMLDAPGGGRKNRPQRRNADLTAVRVAGQHQVGVLGSGPAKLIGTVRQARCAADGTSSLRNRKRLGAFRAAVRPSIQGRSLPVNRIGLAVDLDLPAFGRPSRSARSVRACAAAAGCRGSAGRGCRERNRRRAAR